MSTIITVVERYADGRENQTADYEQRPGETWKETLKRDRYADQHVVFDPLGPEGDPLGPDGELLIVNVYPALHQIGLRFRVTPNEYRVRVAVMVEVYVQADDADQAERRGVSLVDRLIRRHDGTPPAPLYRIPSIERSPLVLRDEGPQAV